MAIFSVETKSERERVGGSENEVKYGEETKEKRKTKTTAYYVSV